MSEKLDIDIRNGGVEDLLSCIKKINELVDAVNGILAAQEQYATIYKEDIMPMLMPENETPADPYAEQRKWAKKNREKLNAYMREYRKKNKGDRRWQLVKQKN